MESLDHYSTKKPPSISNGIFSDLINFFFHKPEHPTLITFESPEERYEYSQRIMHRIGIDTEQYSVLNINKIGIDAPAKQIFKELMLFRGNPSCWPNYIAKVDRGDNELKHVRILPFGWKKYPFKFMKSFLGLPLIPLFLLDAIRIKNVPDANDPDNARYFLYACSGGYPIGILAIYVRPSIPDMGETNQSQVIFGVGFNFFGKQEWQKKRKLVSIVWEKVHNRVTANVLNRIKQLSEWRMEAIREKANGDGKRE